MSLADHSVHIKANLHLTPSFEHSSQISIVYAHDLQLDFILLSQ